MQSKLKWHRDIFLRIGSTDADICLDIFKLQNYFSPD